jgi:glycosyltransferase involved in cell wall biosynthesis
VPEIAFVQRASAGGIGRHVRMLASATGGSVISSGGPLAIRRMLRGADIVHAHGVRAGALAVLAARGLRPRPPLVVTIHNDAPQSLGARLGYRVLELIVARGADVVLTVSDDLASRMRSLGARRVSPAVVAAPVLASAPGPTSASVPAPASESASVGPPRPVVLAVGRLAPQKDFATLIAAAPAWRDLARVMIVGSGPLENELRDLAAASGANIEFTGHRDDVGALLASAAVFVLPSRWEGQPLVLQEALRAGVPVVATRVGGIPALTGPDAAVLVPPGDPDALGGAVRAVLTDPPLAARLRAAALARAATLPTEADAVAAIRAVYASLALLPVPFRAGALR